MTAFSPAYRLVVYGADDTTPLSPIAGSGHSDPLKVASVAGLTGYQPYLDFPSGRRSRIDFVKRTLDIGTMTFAILDKRLTPGGSNFARWLTAFIGDTNGNHLLTGKKCAIEFAPDGSTWAPFMSGRIRNVSLGPDRNWLTLTVHENAEAFKSKVFVGRPHPSVTYADSSSLLPLGPPIPYGGFEAVPTVPATVKAWSIPGQGSGLYLDVEKFAIKTGDFYTELTTVTQPLADLIREYPSVPIDEQSADLLNHTKIMVDVLTAAGAPIGSYYLTRVPIQTFGFRAADFGFIVMAEVGGRDGAFRVIRVGIAELPATDPRHAALPTAGTSVGFRLILTGEPNEMAPIFVDSVHPAQLFEDLVDGHFGTFQENGTPYAIPKDAAAFAARKAETFSSCRFMVTEAGKMSEWVEKKLCMPFHMAYRTNGAGEVVPVNFAYPASAAGIPTIDASDVSSASMPGWEVDLDRAVAEVVFNFYSDAKLDPISIFHTSGQVIHSRPTWIESAKQTIDGQIGDSPALGITDPLEIDGSGFRYSVGAGTTIDNLSQGLRTILRAKWSLHRWVQVLTGGMASISLSCRRTPDVDSCFPGDLRIVDIDEIPDPLTRLRGGPRLARCVSADPEGLLVGLSFVDLGSAVVASPPSLGAAALVPGREQEAIQIPVTLNGAGEAAVVWFAVTPTGDSRPAESSSLWVFGLVVTTSMTVTISNLPSGLKVWPRARTEPIGALDLKIPSSWVFPSNNSITLTGLPAPSGLSVVDVTGSEATVLFTPGRDDLLTDQLFDGELIRTLPAGSNRAVYHSLAGSGTAGLRHRNPATGAVSSTVTIALVLSGPATTGPSIKGIRVLVGEVG